MDTKEHLISAKKQFVEFRCTQILPAITSVKTNSLSALSAKAAMAAALPVGFTSIRDFETSRNWSRKEACKMFDRAIEAQPIE